MNMAHVFVLPTLLRQNHLLELTPFHGHFIVPQEGVRDVQTEYP